MNWLFYIGGWFFGWAIFNSLVPHKDNPDLVFFVS
jgi:hypothetical protein